jgi:hypothetical protein
MKNIDRDRTEYWLREGRETVIVLLHGIGAKDPKDYWQQFLDIVLHDPTMRDFGIFVWKYPTHTKPGWLSNLVKTFKRRTLVETAPTIKRLGEAWRTTYCTQFSMYKNVFLVCHSMGGLVVKSWVIDTLDSQGSAALEQLTHISFYATPHNGAPIATLTKWNNQLQDMKLDAPFIKSVSERWHNHVVACKGRILEPADHRYNRYIPHLVIAGISDQVVPDYCATIQGIELTTVQGDHSQVIQPIDEQDTRYKVWRDAVQNVLTTLRASKNVLVSERHPEPSRNTLHNPTLSPVEQREQTILLTCGDIERAQPGPQYPSVATLVHALQDKYAIQDVADTLEWLEQRGDVQLLRVFADPERHHHHIEAWSFSLTAQGKRKRALLTNT